MAGNDEVDRESGEERQEVDETREMMIVDGADGTRRGEIMTWTVSFFFS